jgi:hypothetical protein
VIVPDEPTTAWLTSLERRHLADLTMSEAARALRALSSCYVERRGRLARGDALGTKGKRAAFALFYGPLHYFTVAAIVHALPSALDGIDTILDLGCGTGAAGAAWALAAKSRTVRGVDRHPWMVAEANAAYRQFGLRGRATQGAIEEVQAARPARAGTGVIAAFAVNELLPDVRASMLAALIDARARGARLLVVEPIAKRVSPWWQEWQTSFERAGGRADEWRFPLALPPAPLGLARAAGLDPRELTARSLFA